MSSSNPYHQEEDDDPLIEPDDPSLNDLDHEDPISSDRAPLTGRIQPDSSGAPISRSYLTSSVPGEDRRAALNTLDESVWQTVRRDLLAVWEKMTLVLWPKNLMGGMLMRNRGGVEGGEGGSASDGMRRLMGQWPNPEMVLEGGMSEGLRNWDLWGPLLFCLLLSLFLSMSADDKQKSQVFSGVFAMVWIGEAVVTAQIKLLGGSISFFQSVCIIGYTLFPLVIASIMSAFGLHWIPRIPVYIVLALWSLAAGVSILGGSGVLKNRVGLAVYPLFIFYIGLACLCFIS